MPYRSNEDLPLSVRNHLPSHAQDIFREAFNHAWEQYADPEKRRMSNSGRRSTARSLGSSEEEISQSRR